MRHLKTFESYNQSFKISENDYKNFLKELSDVMERYDILEDFTPEEYLEIIIDTVVTMSNSKKVTLFRVVWAKKKKSIDKGNIGNHFVANNDDFHEEMLDELFNIVKGSDKLDFYKDCYLLTVSCNGKDIDVRESIYKQCLHPHENEFFINDDNSCKVIKIDNMY